MALFWVACWEQSLPALCVGDMGLSSTCKTRSPRDVSNAGIAHRGGGGGEIRGSEFPILRGYFSGLKE